MSVDADQLRVPDLGDVRAGPVGEGAKQDKAEIAVDFAGALPLRDC
jgi:hypothetical protein